MAADWESAYTRLKARTENQEERAYQVLALALDDVAGYAGSAIIGYLHGRKGGIPAPGGIPMDAGVGGVGAIGAWTLTLLGYPQYGRPIGSFGRSMGGYWVADIFAQWGEKRREKAGEKKNRELTTEEARKAGVVVRKPIMGSRRHVGGAALREEMRPAA